MVGLAIYLDESEQSVWNHDWNLLRMRENYRFELQERILAWKLFFFILFFLLLNKYMVDLAIHSDESEKHVWNHD